jgi:NAD-dependent deacetylase
MATQASTPERARAELRTAASIAVLTGAGISEESGVPVFRGPGGLWRQYRPEDLATPEAFARSPELVWEWYDWRRIRIASAQPNPAHEALVHLEKRCPSFALITQNVDGLHDLAGSRQVIKLHGDIWTVRCQRCGGTQADRRVPLPEIPPRCRCGGVLRPGVVWFGESLPPEAWQAAAEAAGACSLFLVVGTSALVYPAAGLPLIAKQQGAKLMEVNFEPTALTPLADYSFQGRAGDLLPRLVG